MEWRLLRDGITDAHHHFAMEEALVRLVDEEQSPPTLRLRQIRRAVFIGAMQDTWSEVDVDYCRAHDIKIVRRANGGGAVYHDTGSFCFSAVFPRALFKEKEDRELYPLFAAPVIRTCADYGFTAERTGRNDLLVRGRKIYGSAQLSWYSAFIQSGTFLVTIDFETMERTLTPPALKFSDKPVHSIRDRVTSLSQESGRKIPVDEVMARFTEHFAAAFNVTLTSGALLPAETELAAELLAVKYGLEEWNLGTRRAYRVSQAVKTAEGVLSLSLELEEGIIREARLTGDWLLTDQGAELRRMETALTGSKPPELAARIAAADLSPELQSALQRLLSEMNF